MQARHPHNFLIDQVHIDATTRTSEPQDPNLSEQVLETIVADVRFLNLTPTA